MRLRSVDGGGEGEGQRAGEMPFPFKLMVWGLGLSHLLGWVSVPL